MRTISIHLALAILGALAGGCASQASYIASDQAALGRVVVYRSGVAYYERKAIVDGDRLVLRVPRDKVDDFLKSLTVVDAQTKQSLPIAFPGAGQASASREAWVDMTIQLPGTGRREVVLSYVTESPAWKPSYRVVVGEGGKVDLQGWAIVDNTSGEDWRQVQVGVGSSSALSFRYDLQSVRNVHRETLRPTDHFAKAPPVGGAVHHEGRNEDVVLAAVADEELARPGDHPDMVAERAASSVGGPPAAAKATEAVRTTGALAGGAAAPSRRYKLQADGAEERKGGTDDNRRLSQLAAQLKASRQDVVVEGFAQAGEADADDRARDRANLLRNQLIERGVAPAQVQAVGRGVVAGQPAGVRLVAVAKTAPSRSPDSADAPPVGESHFDSRTPLTVGKGTSAMVSIVQGPAQGEVVYLYDADSSNGDARYAFKAVRFQNPTSSTLESGPMTVYGAGRFIGEGLAEPIPPGASAVVPFALDRQVAVDREGSTSDRMSRLVKLNRGVLTAEVQHVRTTRLQISNRSHQACTVLVRHNTPKGWSIAKGPQAVQVMGESRLYAVQVPAGERRTLEIEEATPLVRTVDLRAPTGVELVRLYLQSGQEDARVQASMTKLLGLFDDMAKAEQQIQHLHARAEEYRSRMDELHGQIFSLKAVKTGGPLMAHLQQKMKEISDKVQETTLATVQAQEHLMVAKVRFQDELAELTLERKPQQAARASQP